MPEQQNPSPSNPDTISPVAIAPDSHAAGQAGRTVLHWLERLLACNPFFLVSAALLLFGMYKVSTDGNFLRTEISQLAFNLTALQFYELLLVVTAIVLARRRIWYDATLLFVLENVLVFAPFILISQAALIKLQVVWLLCPAAAMLTIFRFVVMHRRGDAFAVPSSCLICGGAVLAVNAALPIVFRILEETKVASNPAGAAYVVSDASWLLLLPALLSLMLLLPRPAERGELFVQGQWFLSGMFLLWMAGTVVHVYCLDYVYDFELRRELVTPAAWVLAWVVCRQLIASQALPSTTSQALLILPLVVPLISAGVENCRIFFTLNAMNVVILTGIALRRHESPFVRQLILISVAITLAALPREWVQPFGLVVERREFIGAAILGYLMLRVALSCNPKLTVFGAIAAAVACGFIFKKSPNAVHWAAQIGFMFFLLHSLRWHDREHFGAPAIRGIVAVSWVIHSLIWARAGIAFWDPIATAGIVLTACGAVRLLNGRWPPIILPIAGLITASSGALHLSIVKVQSAPIGVLAMIGSFSLFAAGTVLAITRHRWHKSDV